MGFWDFIAPDYDQFVAAVAPYVPVQAQLGSITLARDQLLKLAYATPASAAGIAARLFYQYGAVQGGNLSQASSLTQAQIDNLTRGGLFPLTEGHQGVDLTGGLAVAPVVVANAYALNVQALFGGQTVINTFHALGTAPGQQVAAAAALRTSWKNNNSLLPIWDGKYTLVGFEATDLSSSTGGVSFVADTTAGTRTTASTAGRQTSALVSFSTGSRSRSQRGRSYLGPLYEPDIDIDGATLLAAGNIDGRMTFFRTAMATAGFPIVILSRKLLATYTITAQVTSTTIATQRRRLR